MKMDSNVMQKLTACQPKPYQKQDTSQVKRNPKMVEINDWCKATHWHATTWCYAINKSCLECLLDKKTKVFDFQGTGNIILVPRLLISTILTWTILLNIITFNLWLIWLKNN